MNPVVVAQGNGAGNQEYMREAAKAIGVERGVNIDQANSYVNDLGNDSIEPIKTGLIAKLWPSRETYHRLYKADDLTLYQSIPNKDENNDGAITDDEIERFATQADKIKEIVKSSYVAEVYSSIYWCSIFLLILCLVYLALFIWADMKVSSVGSIVLMILGGVGVVFMIYYRIYKLPIARGAGQVRIDEFVARLSKLKNNGFNNIKIHNILQEEHDAKQANMQNNNYNNNNNNNYNNNNNNNSTSFAKLTTASAVGNIIADTATAWFK